MGYDDIYIWDTMIYTYGIQWYIHMGYDDIYIWDTMIYTYGIQWYIRMGYNDIYIWDTMIYTYGIQWYIHMGYNDIYIWDTWIIPSTVLKWGNIFNYFYRTLNDRRSLVSHQRVVRNLLTNCSYMFYKYIKYLHDRYKVNIHIDISHWIIHCCNKIQFWPLYIFIRSLLNSYWPFSVQKFTCNIKAPSREMHMFLIVFNIDIYLLRRRQLWPGAL